MMMLRSCCYLAGLVLACLSSTTAAAAPATSAGGDAYSRGVQAYFSGNCAEAEPLLMEATGQNPKDPRPYYFHGLCLLRQGQVDQARSNFMFAAALEAHSRRSYPVGKSLERVQGGDRLMLEQYRWRAQPAAPAPRLVAPIESNRRGSIAIKSDAGVLRQAASVPLDELAHPVSLADLTGLAEMAPATTASAAIEESVPQAARGAIRDADTPSVATGPTGNPFADDQQTPHDGKIPSGKLMGIVGRAMMQAAPVPSVDTLRDQLPSVPLLTGSDPTPPADADADADADTDATFVPAEEEDPFFESTPAPTDAEPGKTAPEAVEEDPFGGF
jgi:hypothetical protein